MSLRESGQVEKFPVEVRLAVSGYLRESQSLFNRIDNPYYDISFILGVILPFYCLNYVIEIYDEAEFFRYVYDRRMKQLIVVDFGATWCPFSRKYDPKLEKLALA